MIFALKPLLFLVTFKLAMYKIKQISPLSSFASGHQGWHGTLHGCHRGHCCHFHLAPKGFTPSIPKMWHSVETLRLSKKTYRGATNSDGSLPIRVLIIMEILIVDGVSPVLQIRHIVTNPTPVHIVGIPSPLMKCAKRCGAFDSDPSNGRKPDLADAWTMLRGAWTWCYQPGQKSTFLDSWKLLMAWELSHWNGTRLGIYIWLYMCVQCMHDYFYFFHYHFTNENNYYS